jgi:hypothetical protein
MHGRCILVLTVVRCVPAHVSNYSLLRLSCADIPHINLSLTSLRK